MTPRHVGSTRRACAGKITFGSDAAGLFDATKIDAAGYDLHRPEGVILVRVGETPAARSRGRTPLLKTLVLRRGLRWVPGIPSVTHAFAFFLSCWFQTSVIVRI